jgi:adenylosuccinate synthase
LNIAIIDPGYGDAGKGLATDFFCHKLLNEQPHKNYLDGAVVRFQGGAQAGHTVVTPEGDRHIFSHFGSGSFLGVPTILAEDFVCNPEGFIAEVKGFNRFYPTIFVDKSCMITTPFDILLNRVIEDNRKVRHGSVGIGFGTTIKRNIDGIKLVYGDISNKKRLISRLYSIAEYTKGFLTDIGIDYGEYPLLTDPDIKSMEEKITLFRSMTWKLTHDAVSMRKDFLIFEGAQGLGLDMDNGAFPHVTRSKTDSTNIIKFCKMFNTSFDTVFYVTRAYSTRHGNGKLSLELSNMKENLINTDFETNQSHKYQGDFRYAPLLMGEIIGRIKKDISRHGKEHHLFITCLDQLRYDKEHYISFGDEICKFTYNEFLDFASKHAMYLSFGPTRNCVIKSNAYQGSIYPMKHLIE